MKKDYRMKIALQRLKDGNVTTFNLPAPTYGDSEVLVQTRFSVISSGTELSRIIAAKSNLLGKALQRPEEFKKVLTAIKGKGLATTYMKVTNQLEQYNRIGYSSSGIVIAKGRFVNGVQVGDKVALAGSGFAVHSEYSVVPTNLCVQVPESVSYESASFATIGSIALQGIRQLHTQLAETVVVIGLGLIGQLAVYLLRANGAKAIGIDISQERIDVAKRNGCDYVFLASDERITDLVKEVTNGYGADGILITASAKSTDPINLAGELARKRGNVVIVGDIGHNFKRKTFYEKELSIKMSCSYGAGRYDSSYEIDGIDYPQAYVPWTIARNMSAFLWLVSKAYIKFDHLMSHTFCIDEAPEAYKLLLENKPDTFAILFEYENNKPPASCMHVIYQPPHERENVHNVNIGIIGVGSYARSFIIPNLDSRLHIKGLMARNPSSLVLKNIDNCEILTTDPEIIISDNEIQTIIIATRHSLHAELVLEGIKEGKNVYVEKPMVTTVEELEKLVKLLSKKNSNICVGFNRRYSSAIQMIDEKVFLTPFESNYIVVADNFSEDYWALQEKEGGIIVGEIIHFVDLLSVLHKSAIVKVSASENLRSINKGIIYITLFFENKTLGNITYIMGSSISSTKERIELYYDNDRILIDGFKKITSVRAGTLYKSRKMDMGREKLFGDILYQFTKGNRVQDLMHLIMVHAAVLAIRESIVKGKIVEINSLL